MYDIAKKAREAMALRILHDVMATQPVPVPYQASQAGVQVATSKHAWRETFFSRSTADSHEAKKKAFNRAADGLAQKGQIGVHHDTKHFTRNQSNGYQRLE